MMPVSLLIALVLAFGIESQEGVVPPSGVPPSDVAARILETCGGVTLIAALAFGLGFWVALRVQSFGDASSRLRRRYALGARLITILSLVVYGWIIHSVGWSKLVRLNWGLNGLYLVDDIAVFLPYVMIQLLVWWGLFFAERALQIRRDSTPEARLGRYLVLRARQSFGLILPVILWYIVRRDVIARFWPDWHKSALAEPIEIAALGTVVLAVSPLFVRLAWPTRALAAGPLRRRLERVAERAGFRFSDILVWDTGYAMVNACVTGILPPFRFVLLTDGLIDSLTPAEAAAVFGHEIGHVAHRHLLYFAFFFIGSLGVLSLLAAVVSAAGPLFERLAWITPWDASSFSEAVQGVALLSALGSYFWVVFGHLSRRFERQADVFGSRVVSCDGADCPPHRDEDLEPSLERAKIGKQSLCPVGIEIFTDALASVARYNGLDQTGGSWRHGSIANRISFLEGLKRHPERERRFQRGVQRLRLGLGLALALAVLLSVVTQSWELWR
jgi:STE24 endopeptidase